MRRMLLLFGGVVVAVLGVALATRGTHQPEFTTSSPEAYALYLKGEDHLDAFQFQEADAALTAALRLDPGFAMAHAALAEVKGGMATRGDWDTHRAAADSLARLLKDENERMLVQLRLSLFDKSQAPNDSLLALLCERRPRHRQVLIARARAAARDRNHAEEEKAWRELLRVDPNYARAWNWLGYAAAGKGRYEEALSHLQKYAFVAPGIANPHDSLGEILMHMGRYEEAEREFTLALQIQPDFFYSLLNLARLYALQGRLAKAAEILERVRSEFSGTPMAERMDLMAAEAYFQHGMFAQARAALVRYLAGAADSEAAGFYRGLVLAAGGRAADGLALVDSLGAALGKKPPYRDSDLARRSLDVRLREFQAMIFELQGEPAQALEAWGRALAAAHVWPPHERWFFQQRYGDILLQVEQPAAALEQAEQILAFNPRLIPPLLLRARSLAALNRQEEARQALAQLRAALALADPDLPAVAAADSLTQRLGGAGPA